MDMTLPAPIAAPAAVRTHKAGCLSRTGLLLAAGLHLVALAGLMLLPVTAAPPPMVEIELLEPPVPVEQVRQAEWPRKLEIVKPTMPTPARPQSVAQPRPAPQPVAQPATPTPVVSQPEPPLASPTPPQPAQVSAPPAPQTPPSPRATAAEPAPAATEPVFNAAYLRNAPPPYPALSRRLREEGRVLLQVRVDAQGLPVSITVHGSSGHARLDNAAREAVEGWRFIPARRGANAIEASVLVPIVFNLEN